jgi:hypothetical protein
VKYPEIRLLKLIF